MDLSGHIQQYLKYLREEEKSAKTQENYRHYLGRFLEWSKAKEISGITADLIKEFKAYLSGFRDEKGKKLKKVTQNYHLIALRNFLRYLQEQGTRSLDVKEVKLNKHERWQVDYLESKELKRLLAAAEGKDLRSLRDRAILTLLFSCGLRVSELCSLKRSSINKNKIRLEVKSRGARDIILDEPAKKALAPYIYKRHDKNKALFIRLPKGNKTEIVLNGDSGLTPRSIQRIVRKYAIKAGIMKKVTPHLLRHTYGTYLFRKGKDLIEVQKILGHASLLTTKAYKKAVEK